MFEFVVSAITSRTDHPFVFSLFLLAGAFAVSGVAVEFATGNGVAAGFLVIYALMSAVLGTIGYLMLYSLKFASIVRDRAMYQ